VKKRSPYPILDKMKARKLPLTREGLFLDRWAGTHITSDKRTGHAVAARSGLDDQGQASTGSQCVAMQ
jgi:hypothetical protein